MVISILLISIDHKNLYIIIIYNIWHCILKFAIKMLLCTIIVLFTLSWYHTTKLHSLTSRLPYPMMKGSLYIYLLISLVSDAIIKILIFKCFNYHWTLQFQCACHFLSQESQAKIPVWEFCIEAWSSGSNIYSTVIKNNS